MPMSPRLLRPRASTGNRWASLRTGLDAYWPLNETAGAAENITAVDWTRRGNDLTSNNTVPSITGRIGNAREFTSANSEWLSANSSADLSLGNGDWTLTLWQYQASLSTSARMLVAKDVSGAREFALFTGAASTSNRVRFEYTGIVGSNLADVDALVAATWHFIAVRKSGNTVTLRVDNSTASFANNATFVTASTPWNIGRRAFSGFTSHFTGYIDEVAKWSRGLSDAELNTLYNSGAGIDLRQ